MRWLRSGLWIGGFAYERCTPKPVLHSLYELATPGRGSLFKINKAPRPKTSNIQKTKKHGITACQGFLHGFYSKVKFDGKLRKSSLELPSFDMAFGDAIVGYFGYSD